MSAGGSSDPFAVSVPGQFHSARRYHPDDREHDQAVRPCPLNLVHDFFLFQTWRARDVLAGGAISWQYQYESGFFARRRLSRVCDPGLLLGTAMGVEHGTANGTSFSYPAQASFPLTPLVPAGPGL